MRAHGPVTEVPEAAAADHLCWVHDDGAAFDDAVRDFLAGGLDRGERLLCVGERAIAALAGATGPLRDVDALVARGALSTMTVDEVYAAAGPLVVERQRAYYEEASRRALDDGYRGLRVVAELTGLAADPEQRDLLARWEHAADEFMASGPGMSAMCAYRADLPPATLGALLSVHPQGRGDEHLSPYRLFFADDAVRLTGSVDASNAERLAATLAGTPVGASPVLDVSGLEFLDVAGYRALAGWAADLGSRGLTSEIRGASALVRRVWQVLDLDAVAPVTFAAPHG